ncbi:hypothetical protein [Algicola sagamiensis]|uniref:hypothetical protein n=1 Tax=Algicola sagamiensis TaxID=163869 RepID=UPI00037F5079|nr:hypothetical protein [Algicola sagamiensis]
MSVPNSIQNTMISPSSQQMGVQHHSTNPTMVRVDLTELPHGHQIDATQPKHVMGLDLATKELYDFDEVQYDDAVYSDDDEQQNFGDFMAQFKQGKKGSVDSISAMSEISKGSPLEAAQGAFEKLQQELPKVPYLLVGSLAAAQYGGIRAPEDVDVIVPKMDHLNQIDTKMSKDDDSAFDNYSYKSQTIKMKTVSDGTRVDIGTSAMYFATDGSGNIQGEDYSTGMATKELLLAAYLVRFDEDGKQDEAQIRSIIDYNDMQKDDLKDILVKLDGQQHKIATERWNTFFD